MSTTNRRVREAVRPRAVLPALEAAQREWLKGALRLGARVKHATLAKASGHRGAELCYDMLEWLIDQGWVSIEETRPRLTATWQPLWVQWRDWEAACAEIGVETPLQRRTQVEALAIGAWSNPDVQALAREVALRASQVLAPMRMTLLRQLDTWTAQERQGTWRDFSLHARGDTKLVTSSERVWLERQLDMSALGVDSHVPLVLVAGALQLDGRAHLRLTSGLSVGLPPALWASLSAAAWSGAEPFAGYLVVENRTNFDRLVATHSARQVVLWCPGYPPAYWRDAVLRLLRHLPGDAAVFCDPDPAGIDIASRIGAVWQCAGSGWAPWCMGPEALTQAAATKPLTDADDKLLAALIDRGLPETLQLLARAMQITRRKAEQEGVVYTA